MLAFHIPGLEFFAITVTDKNNSEWRNPAGTWFRQVIPTGCQLLNLFDEIKKECIEANKDDPNYDYQDDSLDGFITWSPMGVHFAPLDDFDVQFEDGEFITSLTRLNTAY